MTGDTTGSERSGPMRLELGSPVHCADGSFGELADIVIDPTARRVTHLVVQPHDRHDLARLVPVAQVHTETTSDATISLDSTLAEIGALEPIQKSAYLRLNEFPVEDPDWDVGIEEMFALPYYQSVDGMGVGIQAIDPDPHVALSYDRVPKGEVEIRHASAVTSSNGDISDTSTASWSTPRGTSRTSSSSTVTSGASGRSRFRSVRSHAHSRMRSY